MKTHPYLRAYMAGVVVPSLFFLLVLVVFVAVRPELSAELAPERMMIFPMALVPAIWGGWNMVYLALAGRARLPLGWHGALIPLALIPVALFLAGRLGIALPPQASTVVLLALAPLALIYYLIWKFVVGFLNHELGIG